MSSLQCPNCHAGNDPGSRFCANCGAQLPTDTPPAAPATVYDSGGPPGIGDVGLIKNSQITQHDNRANINIHVGGGPSAEPEKSPHQQYKELVYEALADDGEIDPSERRMLDHMSAELGLSGLEKLELESAVRNLLGQASGAFPAQAPAPISPVTSPNAPQISAGNQPLSSLQSPSVNGPTFIESSAMRDSERPEDVATYRQAVATFLADGILEDWEHVELIRLRAELSISAQTHQEIISDLQCSTPEAVALYVDVSAMADYRVGAQCIIRTNVVNEGSRALQQVLLAYSTTAQIGVHQGETGVLGPDQDSLVTARFQPEIHGQHEFQGVLTIRSMRGDAGHYRLRPVHFRVGREDDPSRGSGGYVAGVESGLDAVPTSGRYLGDGVWHKVPLKSCSPDDVERWETSAREQMSGATPAQSPQPTPACSPPPPVQRPRQKVVTVGREVDNDMVLQSAQVSRHHATVEFDGQNIILTDRGSSNGTHVNGAKISAPTIIWPGDLIGFGSYTVTGEVFWQRLK